jgi:hypothetical protein
MPKMQRRRSEDPLLIPLIRAIVGNDASEVANLLGSSPFLARQYLAAGATRQAATDFYFE